LDLLFTQNYRVKVFSFVPISGTTALAYIVNIFQ